VATLLIIVLAVVGVVFWMVISTGNERASVASFLSGTYNFLRNLYCLMAVLFMKVWKGFQDTKVDPSCQVTFEWNDPSKVGEHVSFRVTVSFEYIFNGTVQP
jgi:hypothetical protein